MTEPIRAPWTAEQVAALNAFQKRGDMHPFTCGGEHTPGSPALVAHTDGWHCPQPYGEPCDYRQDWAHPFMADPSAWLAVPAVVSPPAADQADLVERGAAAIWARYSDAEPSRHGLVMANPHAVAAAVLSILPEHGQATVRAALDRVLGLHSRDNFGRCSYCSWLDDQAGSGLDVSHPCDTVRAADPSRLADEAQQGETQPTPSREAVEYFLQCQQADGTWEMASSYMHALDWATERLAAKRAKWPDFMWRMAQRITTVAVRALPDCPDCRHWSCTGGGPCGALLDSWQRCDCSGPSAEAQQGEPPARRIVAGESAASATDPNGESQ